MNINFIIKFQRLEIYESENFRFSYEGINIKISEYWERYKRTLEYDS
jgi:hypothetical protein